MKDDSITPIPTNSIAHPSNTPKMNLSPSTLIASTIPPVLFVPLDGIAGNLSSTTPRKHSNNPLTFSYPVAPLIKNAIKYPYAHHPPLPLLAYLHTTPSKTNANSVPPLNPGRNQHPFPSKSHNQFIQIQSFPNDCFQIFILNNISFKLFLFL